MMSPENEHLLNLSIVVLFLLATFFISKTAAIRALTMQEYADSNHSVGGGVLTAALVGALVSSYNTGSPSPLKATGDLFFSLFFALSAGLFIWWLSRLAAFKKCETSAELMEHFYKKTGYHATLVITGIFALLVVVVQLQALASISAILQIPTPLIIAIAGTLITLYFYWYKGYTPLTLGIFQITCIIVGIAVLIFISSELKETARLATSKQPVTTSFFQQFLDAFFWIFWPTLLITPPLVQRGIRANKKEQIRHLALLYIVFRFILIFAIIGFLPIFMSEINLLDKIRTLKGGSFIPALLLPACCSLILATIETYLHTFGLLWGREWARRNPDAKEKSIVYQACQGAIYASIATTIIAIALSWLQVNPLCLLSIGMVLLSVLVVPFIAGVAKYKKRAKTFQRHLKIFFGTLLLAHPLVWWYSSYLPIFLFGGQEIVGNYFPILRLTWLISLCISTLLFFGLPEKTHTKKVAENPTT